MKSIALTLCAFVFAVALSAQQKADDYVKMNTEVYDFGKIKQGTPVTYYFELTNKSEKAILIENAYSTCGCTVPEYPKAPIASGATIKLKVQYNAATVGHFDKDVFIKLAGVAEPKSVKIKGDVETSGK